MQGQNVKVEIDLQQERSWILASQKDPSAFEPLFQKYHDVIFNYALRRTCNVNHAQDITANTFLKSLDHIHSYQWKGISFCSWLYRIATNEINLNHRKFKRMVPLTSELAANLKSDRTTDSELIEIEDSIQKNEKFKKACAALAKLPLKYQTILSLRYFEEKSVKEIAEILELSGNTVKTQIRRGLIQLRKQL